MILNYLYISRKLFSFYRIKSSAIPIRSQSVRKCSETVVMNLQDCIRFAKICNDSSDPSDSTMKKTP